MLIDLCRVDEIAQGDQSELEEKHDGYVNRNLEELQFGSSNSRSHKYRRGNTKEAKQGQVPLELKPLAAEDESFSPEDSTKRQAQEDRDVKRTERCCRWTPQYRALSQPMVSATPRGD